ncbi:MAG: hypothetical protein JSW43_02065 [Gemmatimonadota bacterium]|nr:MAG: hypothetical protein JSW43_02065 [Gemmatimonadota bacterium]
MACVDLEDTATSTVWEAELEAELAFPDVSGEAAAVTRPEGGTAVGVDLRGAEPGAMHQWAVLLGSCASPGAQIGPDSDYPVLEVGLGGSASADTQLGLTLTLPSTYHVEVRVSATDASRVACGDLLPR